MLFSIDEDAGSHIIGWLMPDNPNSSPTVHVLTGSDVLAVEAAVYRPLLKDQGLHNTGICGFVINSSNFPELATVQNLSIVDSATGVLLYRRTDAPSVKKRLLYVETSIWPIAKISDLIGDRFQMPYKGVDQYNEETIRAIFGISFSDSIFVSGRLFIKQFDYLYRDRGFRTSILLRDPFEELAERILILNWMRDRQDAPVFNRIARELKVASSKLPALDLASTESVSEVLGDMTEDVRNVLYNPVARQLSTRFDQDHLDPAAVAISLDTLSLFDIVGVRSDVSDFMQCIGTTIDQMTPAPTIASQPSDKIIKGAQVLRETPIASELVRYDHAIFEALVAARNKVLKETKNSG